MPPRHAFWTILVDNEATAFRAHDADDLLATLNRLKEKHPSAVMKWFERGQLWNSREEARQMAAGRGDRRGERPPKPASQESAGSGAPRREATSPQGKRSDERPRDGRWRPGGDHRDPRQKYRDAKKAKWRRFKHGVRARWEARQHDEGGRPRGPATDERPPRDRRSETRRFEQRPPQPWRREEGRRDERRFDDRRDDTRRDRQPWGSRGDRPARKPADGGGKPAHGGGRQERWGSGAADRKPWAPKPRGARPKGKPFGGKGPRGPRTPDRRPRKRRDDE